ncbi:MAG: hypothetical protein AABY22_23680 [Nanoarchaeota archaeon]
MKLNVEQGDVDEAYRRHRLRGWGLFPADTPPAIAMSRVLGKAVRVGYESVRFDEEHHSSPVDLREYVRSFADSLLAPLAPIDLQAIRDFHSTNSDHAKPVPAPRKEGMVGPASFDLPFVEESA